MFLEMEGIMTMGNDIFSVININEQTDERGQKSLLVSCLMDGVPMPVRKLQATDALFIGDGPRYTDAQKLWAARMAYRKDMQRNQRVQNLYVRQDGRGDWYVRCKIDGRQMISSQLTRTEVNMYKRGLLTERELVDRHYASVLQDERGQTLDRSESRNLTLGISQKKK